MKITTFTVDKYKDCPIYYRNFKNVFEYLTIINGQLYTTHLSLKPHWVTKILYILKVEKIQYSRQHIDLMLKQLRRLAETTIDVVLDESNKGNSQ